MHEEAFLVFFFASLGEIFSFALCGRQQPVGGCGSAELEEQKLCIGMREINQEVLSSRGNSPLLSRLFR